MSSLDPLDIIVLRSIPLEDNSRESNQTIQIYVINVVSRFLDSRRLGPSVEVDVEFIIQEVFL